MSTKYSGLDLDTAPEIYEDTPELSNSSMTDDESPYTPSLEEYISEDKFDANFARQRFRNSDVDGTGVDFTSKTRGWRVSKREETRQEKLARIRKEIEELKSSDTDASEEYTVSDLALLETLMPTSRPANKDINMVPAKTQVDEHAKVSLLEARLATLERRLGPMEATDLTKDISMLSTKVKVLTSSDLQIEQTAQRLKALSEEATNYASLTNNDESAGILVQVRSLYGALNTIHELAPTVPLLLERLRSLQTIHEDAANVHESIETIQGSLLKRDKEIEDWQKALVTLTANLENGTRVIKNDVLVVQKLVEDLGTKVTRRD